MHSSSAKLMTIGTGLVLVSVAFMTLQRRGGSGTPGALKVETSFIDSERLVPDGKNVGMVFARFELRNTGGLPVRIVKVQSGCGCATPKVAPLLIEPDAHGVVDVEARRPPFGEKLVDFTIYTDSPLTPKLGLRLRTTSARQPPYVATVTGELTFNGNIKVGDYADLLVTELALSESGQEPVVEASLPFLKSILTRVEHEPKARPGLWVHTYRYRIGVIESPRSGTQSGVLTVIDPWDASHAETLRIYVAQTTGLRVFPATLTLNLTSDEDSTSRAQFIVIGGRRESNLEVRQESAPRSQFIVEQDGSSREGAVATMVLRLKPGQKADAGDHRLIVSSDGQPDVVLPVTLTIAGKP